MKKNRRVHTECSLNIPFTFILPFAKMWKIVWIQFGFCCCLQLNGSIRPVPPPRDHLRMEKDGRMVNRAPAPQVPDRNPALQTHQIAQIVDATQEQLDSIKKYQVNTIYYDDVCFVFSSSHGALNSHFQYFILSVEKYAW